MIRSRAVASRTPAAPPGGRYAPLDPPARSQNPAATRDREPIQACPDQGNHDPETSQTERLRSPADAGKAGPRAFSLTSLVAQRDAGMGSERSRQPRRPPPPRRSLA